MAIDVFIDSSLTPPETQEVVERIRADRPDIFPEHFHLTDAYAPSELDRIVMIDDFDFETRSGFIIGLNNKQRLDLAEVVGLVKSYFDEREILSTFDGKRAFPPWPLDEEP